MHMCSKASYRKCVHRTERCGVHCVVRIDETVPIGRAKGRNGGGNESRDTKDIKRMGSKSAARFRGMGKRSCPAAALEKSCFMIRNRRKW